ncbi:hypothetical protein [Jatrophihabitans sp.]|uniref:hypothetical protein n=1 Tax=Jatrophihabitans sp. TaxID=1932789 RepID=UPI003F81548F
MIMGAGVGTPAPLDASAFEPLGAVTAGFEDIDISDDVDPDPPALPALVPEDPHAVSIARPATPARRIDTRYLRGDLIRTIRDESRFGCDSQQPDGSGGDVKVVGVRMKCAAEPTHPS